MLTRMLLHVIEPPFPVNLTMDFFPAQLTLHIMKNYAVFFFNPVHFNPI